MHLCSPLRHCYYTPKSPSRYYAMFLKTSFTNSPKIWIRFFWNVNFVSEFHTSGMILSVEWYSVTDFQDKTCRAQLQGSKMSYFSSSSSYTVSTLMTGSIGLSEMSVSQLCSKLRKTPKERRHHLYSDGTLKSLIFLSLKLIKIFLHFEEHKNHFLRKQEISLNVWVVMDTAVIT